MNHIKNVLILCIISITFISPCFAGKQKQGKRSIFESKEDDIDIKFPELLTHLINGDHNETPKALYNFLNELALYTEEEKKYIFKLALNAFFEFKVDENFLSNFFSINDFSEFLRSKKKRCVHKKKGTLLDVAVRRGYSDEICAIICGYQETSPITNRGKAFVRKKGINKK